MNTAKLIEELTDYVLRETKELSDTDYLDVLESVASNLDDCVNAKKEEMKDTE